MYHGGFETNRSRLAPGARSFVGSDGTERELPAWPAEATGLRIGFMEKPGKRFFAVRVVDDKEDLVLDNEVLIDFVRHLGHGRRLSAEPTVIGDETAAVLLADLIARNPKQRPALENFRVRLRKPAKGEGSTRKG